MPLRAILKKANRQINLDGEIDLSNRDELLFRLSTLTALARQRYTLDFTDVTFMDCSGIYVVLSLDRRVREEGGTLHIGAVSPPVARLFELLAPYNFPTHLMPHPAPRRTRTLTTCAA
jgi:anti-anti-sigma factor